MLGYKPLDLFFKKHITYPPLLDLSMTTQVIHQKYHINSLILSELKPENIELDRGGFIKLRLTRDMSVYFFSGYDDGDLYLFDSKNNIRIVTLFGHLKVRLYKVGGHSLYQGGMSDMGMMYKEVYYKNFTSLVSLSDSSWFVSKPEHEFSSNIGKSNQIKFYDLRSFDAVVPTAVLVFEDYKGKTYKRVVVSEDKSEPFAPRKFDMNEVDYDIRHQVDYFDRDIFVHVE